MTLSLSPPHRPLGFRRALMNMKPATGFTVAQAIRAILIPSLFTSILFPSLYQPLLDRIWRTLRESSFYRLSTFETIWTVFWYALIEVSMTVVFMKNPGWRLSGSPDAKPVSGAEGARSKPRGMRRPSRRIKEILIYMAPLLAMDLTMIKKFAGVSLADMLESGNYDTARAFAQTEPSKVTATNGSSNAWPWQRQTSSFLVPTLHNFTSSSPLQLTRALPSEPPTSTRLATECITSFLIYDAIFFTFHLALHIIPPLRRWHAPHHAHDAQLNPQVTNQLSVFERLGLVLLANFSLNIIRAHVLTRTLFVPLFVWFLVEIHSGLDLPWGYDKVLPRGWGGGARKHMRHHLTGDNKFEPFLCWCDDLWGMVSRRRNGNDRGS